METARATMAHGAKIVRIRKVGRSAKTEIVAKVAMVDRESRRPGFTGFGGFSREGGFTDAFQGFSRGRERAEGETANRPADAGPRAGGMLFNPGRRRGGFAGLDKNQDGGVDREEAPEPMRDRFDHLDIDHDGKVTSSEFFRAIADEYGLNQRTEQE